LSLFLRAERGELAPRIRGRGVMLVRITDGARHGPLAPRALLRAFGERLPTARLRADISDDRTTDEPAERGPREDGDQARGGADHHPSEAPRDKPEEQAHPRVTAPQPEDRARIAGPERGWLLRSFVGVVPDMFAFMASPPLRPEQHEGDREHGRE